MSTSTILQWVVVGGITAIIPLALGGPVWRWVAAGAAALVAFLLPRGVGAAALAVPFVVVAGLALWERRRDGLAVTTLPAVWAVVAAQSLVTSRGGWVVLGQEEPFVLLTAVHYVFAGVGALTLALRTGHRAAIVPTAGAPPLIAAGFVLPASLLLVVGAVVLTVGVYATAALQLRAATAPASASGRPRRDQVLLTVSSLAVVVPMVLAVLWAAGNRWPGVPHLDVSAMVPFHGLVNALGFVTCGLLARPIMEPCSTSVAFASAR